MKTHTIRIVGGQYRRTPIAVFNAPSLRPTPDRVRETLFNWLHHLWQGHFADKRVLDLFAGSGALGFEAASRGAGFVQMIESDPHSAMALRRLRDRLNAQNVRIHRGDAMQFLRRAHIESFDLIFLDPPFEADLLPRLWEPVASIMASDGLVYVESNTRPEPPPHCTVVRRARAGQVHFALLRFDTTQKSDNNSALTCADAPLPSLSRLDVSE